MRWGYAAGLAVVSLYLSACGRYEPPVPPEVVAPRGVRELAAVAGPESVTLTWQSPEVNRRSQELKSLDGYTVYRKLISSAADVTDPKVEFDSISTIEDRSVSERDRLRVEARSEGKIGRTVKVPPELTHFSFEDKSVVQGQTYLYNVTPVNQGGVEGEVRQMVRILFRGAQSDVSIFDAKTIESEDVYVDEDQLQ